MMMIHLVLMLDFFFVYSTLFLKFILVITNNVYCYTMQTYIKYYECNLNVTYCDDYKNWMKKKRSFGICRNENIFVKKLHFWIISFPGPTYVSTLKKLRRYQLLRLNNNNELHFNLELLNYDGKFMPKM